MTGLPRPAEVYTPLGLRPGMTVHDDTRTAPAHTVTARDYLGAGQWLVRGADGWVTVCGARHRFVLHTDNDGRPR